MVDSIHKTLSKSCQFEILGFSESGFYYKPKRCLQQEIDHMNAIDKIHTEDPTYGVRTMKKLLERQGFRLGRKRIKTLFLKMGICVQYPQKRTTIPNLEHRIFPYLLGNMKIERINQVWQTDITYIPMKHGFMFLMAIIDVKSRKVLHWDLSNTMDKHWCCKVLRESIAMYGAPEFCNTDQGSQFTSPDFTDILKDHNVQVSMSRKAKATDNAYIERLWRTVKQENIYKNVYENGTELNLGLIKYFKKYNSRRPHQSLDYRTPDEVYKLAA
jgi:putative transposase